tara:strand:+ start:685 stop:924 length:240 start_codon:yes stop_codon:yes gene_type:complete
MSKLIVFNDSHQADGFEMAVASVNECLEKDRHEIRVKIQFIEDYVSDQGEFAYHLTIVPDDLPETVRTGPRLEVTKDDG